LEEEKKQKKCVLKYELVTKPAISTFIYVYFGVTI
jgi:hypothetical protein